MSNEIQGFTVLVVDDDDDFREVMMREVRKAGFNVLGAEGVTRALEVIGENPGIALVVSDIRMPGSSGIDLLKSLNPSHRHAPKVIFVTGYSEATLEDAFDLGAEAVIQKPFDRAAFRGAVERVLAQYDRKWPNRPTRIPVDLEIRVGPGEGGSRTSNIGRGGFFVETEGPFPACGSEISFRIVVEPGLPPVSGTGIVRWIRENSVSGLPSGMGIEFRDFEGDGRVLILNFINRLTNGAFIPKQ